MKKRAIFLLPIAAMMFTSCTIVEGGGQLGPTQQDEEREENDVQEIEVTVQPGKTVYHPGETFDPTGMVVTVTFADNSQEDVTDYEISPNGPLAETDTVVTISYGGKSTSVPITVTSQELSNLAKAYIAAEKLGKDEESTEKYAMEGVVVGKRTNKSDVDVFVQDGIYGMDYFKAPSTFEIGKKVQFEATVANYNGMPETKTVTEGSAKVLGDGVMPTAVNVTSATVLTGTKINVLANVTGTIKTVGLGKATSITGAEDVTLTLNVNDSDVDVFFKKNTYASLLTKVQSLSVGDQITVTNGIRGIYATSDKTNHQILVVDNTLLTVPEKTITKIEIEGTMTKKDYSAGDNWSTAGLSVKATYSNSTTSILNGDLFDYVFNPTAPGTGVTSVTVKAVMKAGGMESQPITVTGITFAEEHINGCEAAYNSIQGLENLAETANTYNVSGTVTHIYGKNVIIQDGEYAILVYLTANATSKIAIGKKLSLISKIKNYNNVPEAANVAEADIQVEDNGPAVTPLAVSGKDTFANLKYSASGNFTNVVVKAKPSTTKTANAQIQVYFADDTETTITLFTDKSVMTDNLVTFYNGLDVGAVLKIDNGYKSYYSGKNQIGVTSATTVTDVTPVKEVKSIEITGSMSKTTYSPSDTEFSAAGLSVTATYTDDSTGTLKSDLYDFVFNPTKPAKGMTSVVVKAVMKTGGIESPTKTFTVSYQDQADSTYVATFKVASGTSDSGTAYTTSSKLSDIFASGEGYFSSIIETSKAYAGKPGTGLKLGASSSAGVLKLGLSDNGKVTAKKIIVNAQLYNASKAVELTVNGVKHDVGATFADIEYEVTGSITTLELSSTKYMYISSVTVVY